MVPRFTLLIALLLSGLAGAQSTAPERHFDLVPTKATAAHESGITLESATPGSTKSLMLSLLLDWNVGILAWVQGNQKLGDVVPYLIDLHLIGAYQLHPRVELAVDLPAALAQGDNFSLLNQYGLSQPGGWGGVARLP